MLTAYAVFDLAPFVVTALRVKSNPPVATSLFGRTGGFNYHRLWYLDKSKGVVVDIKLSFWCILRQIRSIFVLDGLECCMEWMRKLFGHGELATKDVVEVSEDDGVTEVPDFERKDASEYPESFESLVGDYNELQESYKALQRLVAAYEFSLQETTKANDLLLAMNVDLVATLRLRADAELAQREQKVDYGTDPNS